MAVVLFDDGVEYTTPITAVRKRVCLFIVLYNILCVIVRLSLVLKHVEPSPSGGESSHTSTPLVERKRRLIERKGGREESTSQVHTHRCTVSVQKIPVYEYLLDIPRQPTCMKLDTRVLYQPIQSCHVVCLGISNKSVAVPRQYNIHPAWALQHI